MPFGGPAESPEVAPGSPPSAEDFWGERSAAIHDAVQAPAPDSVAVAPARRRLAAAACLAIALAAGASVVFGLGGAAPRATGGARLDMAAVLSGGVSRMVQRGVALVDQRAASSPTAGHRLRTVRRIPHRQHVFRPVHETPHHPTSVTRAVSVDVSRAAPVSTVVRQPVTTASPRRASPPPASHSASSSGATVSPTGESGALGPIQSPNG